MSSVNVSGWWLDGCGEGPACFCRLVTNYFQNPTFDVPVRELLHDAIHVSAYQFWPACEHIGADKEIYGRRPKTSCSNSKLETN